ncbi:MAG: nickel pincer cofactor biosynthesis protein LarC [Chloroflexi bacterium]|nr:nickel pincer cofactor biosynthesis protein LarC [Chloroflexota bacterium]
MVLGALLDAGVPLDALTRELARLPLKGYRLGAEPAQRGMLHGTRALVEVEEAATPRSLEQILELIASSDLPQPVKEQGSHIFQRLAQAEARVHRQPVSEVHLHEVGAVDALVDVMGAVIGLHILGVARLFSSPLPGGSGTVTSQHGILPLPAPAAIELIRDAGAPLRATADPSLGELVTPTGAAIVTTLASFEEPTLWLQAVGYGAGSRDLPGRSNMLRLWVGEEVSAAEAGVLLIETNIDDMSPQLLGHVQERLFELGARDVWFTPIQMKKNRPAVMLSLLADAGAESRLVETLLRETSTLGMRLQRVRRYEADREVVVIDSSLGPVAVKVKRLGGAILGLAPEYEDCRRLAREHHLPLQQVYRTVESEAREKLLNAD